jgi:agmatine deiminase
MYKLLKMKKLKRVLLILLVTMNALNGLNAQTYTFPDESEQHEGTWLQWPHHYEYGTAYRNENDATWVAMTNALQANEKVHIIAYNSTEQTRITALLTAANVPLTNVNFKLFQTNDVWIRDNGPIYVRNASGNLVIQDWGFNGWGGDYNSSKCTVIPASIATATSTPVLNLNSVMTLEGGSIEMDGHGVLLATKSAILSQSNPSAQIKSIRNLGMTEAQANAIFTQYLGATKFYWLEGTFSTDDITDFHIDGFAKFAAGNKLVTMNQADLLYWGATQADINTLYSMTNANNIAYTKVYLPLTQNNVSKTNGTNLGYKGSYCNYYLANNRVLVPNYNDPNDAVANAIIAGLYPNRTVVGIDCRNLYASGGMVHCVTQQQPLAVATVPVELVDISAKLNTNNTSTIAWETASERNTSHFDVESSLNGLIFTKIAALKASGNSSEAKKYTYIDNTFTNNSTVYYRLKTVDLDGKETLSKVVSVKNGIKNTFVLYPNPTTDVFTISNIEEGGRLEIIDEAGRLVREIHPVNNGQSVDIQNLSAGKYFVRLINDKEARLIKSTPLIKTN